MLPAAHRLRRSVEFGLTVRGGVRAGRSTMVVHFLAGSARTEPAMVGFVVSKAVGNAVVRNQVKRRLRGAMAEHMDLLPEGSCAVVRALPASAAADYASLGRDLTGCLSKAVRVGSIRALEQAST